MSCKLRIKFTLKHKFHRPGTHNHPLMSTQFRHKIWKLHLNNNHILKKNESLDSLICTNGLLREDPFLRWKKGTALQSLWVWKRRGGQASERGRAILQELRLIFTDAVGKPRQAAFPPLQTYYQRAELSWEWTDTEHCDLYYRLQGCCYTLVGILGSVATPNKTRQDQTKTKQKYIKRGFVGRTKKKDN